MKLRTAAFAIVPALLAAAPAPPPAADLVVISVTSPHLDRGIVRVQVRNQGTADAPPSLIMVQLTGLQQGTTTVPMIAVPKNGTVIKDVPTGKSLSQVHYFVRVDRANVVPESNEQNNTFSGQFGG